MRIETFWSRRRTVSKLYRIELYLGSLRWNGNGFGPIDEGDKLALQLVDAALKKDGNFYVNRNGFPIWQQNLDNRIRRVRHRLRVLLKALIFSDDVDFFE